MHRWHFFRAGGVDQVSLRDGRDVLALRELDQKLWAALAMPVDGLDIDRATLSLIDLDTDGRIRVQDLLTAVGWVETTFKRPDDVLRSSDEIQLDAIADPKIVAAAKRMLTDLGKPDARAITVADTDAITQAFSATLLNGDGVVIPTSTPNLELRRVIEDVIATIGSVTDRSGKPGVDQARADEFFAAVDARVAWLQKGKDPALQTIGSATDPASTALLAVRAKLEDYFTRCRIAAFDPRAAAALSGQDAELVALATRTLSPADEELAKLPLARIDPSGQLPLGAGLNPAWAVKMATFVEATVLPILGARDVLTEADLATIVAKLAPYDAWRADETKTKVDPLAADWLERLAQPELRLELAALISEDAALAGEYDQITSVAKAVRLQRDLGRILRNFVNFSDFYSRKDGAFQAGTLYLDARALHLCVFVADTAKHSALAAASDSCLVYCEIKRKGETRNIAAAVTNGDADNLFIGRNGIFYDRDGNDWDATVTKVVANPISVREAFWSPYKKLVKTIEESVSKRIAAADAESNAKVAAIGESVANADKVAIKAPAPPVKKIDLGTVAALGVAIGGIGTLFGAVLSAMFGLGPWLPLGVLAILLLISGPAMALAYLKLRRRNLGPILDANGWAINGRARINVTFGAAMTELAKLPKGSQRTLDDPYADRKTPWKRWVALAAILLTSGTWYVGKLDRFLPAPIRSVKVLGKYAPAYQAPDPAADAAPKPAETPEPAPPAAP